MFLQHLQLIQNRQQNLFFILNEEEADSVEGSRGKPCLQGWWCSIITEGFAVSKCH